MIDDVNDKNEDDDKDDDDGEHMIKPTFCKTGELIEEANASIKARRSGVDLGRVILQHQHHHQHHHHNHHTYHIHSHYHHGPHHE